MKLLIQQGQLIDPSRTYAGIYDILIENETIAKIAPHITRLRAVPASMPPVFAWRRG